MATGQVLVSNDDGVNAPGLRVLASALVRASTDVVVCGPSRERSAQSHALSLGPTLSAAPIKVDGVDDAWAVEGTPADSVALALNSPILKRRNVKLVVSGINRGHNCGLHVIYSGTVGAAREAAIQGLPAVALSLDNSKARATDAYEAGAALSVALVRALEGALPGQESRTAPLEALKGVVVNVNIPSQWLADGGSIRGFHFCSQGTFCSFAHFKEMPSLEGDEVRHDPNDPDGQLVFKAFPGPSARCAYRRAFRPGRDDTEGCDTWAMEHGWISVTLLRLRQDVTCMKTPEEGRQLAALAEAVAAAAAYAGVEAAGFSPSPAL